MVEVFIVSATLKPAFKVPMPEVVVLGVYTTLPKAREQCELHRDKQMDLSIVAVTLDELGDVDFRTYE